MNLKSNNLVSLVLLFLILLFSNFVNGNTLSKPSNNEGNRSYKDNELEFAKISNRIHIDNNWSAAKTAGICTGDGTYSNPYVIEDLIIDGGGSGSCILIENTNVYFKIENCTVYNSGNVASDAGIELEQVSNGSLIANYASFNNYGVSLDGCNNNTLLDNTANFNNNGIRLWHSNKITVLGNTAFNNSDGLDITFSNYNTITGNTARNNTYTGLLISQSNGNRILGNTVTDNPGYTPVSGMSNGIFLWDCNDSIVSGNTVNRHIEGLRIDYGNNNTITGNTANNCTRYGIFLNDCNNNTVSKNIANLNVYHGIYFVYCNNSRVIANRLNRNYRNGAYLFHSNDNLVLGNIFNYNIWSSYSEESSSNNFFIWNVQDWQIDPFIIDDSGGGGNFTWNETEEKLAWIYGLGTYSDPYIIENLIIDGGGSGNCILIENSTVYFKVENCTVYNSGEDDSGIRLDYADNGQLLDNNCSSKNYNGILIWSSDNNTLSGNIGNNNNNGICLRYSNNNRLSGNTAIDNDDDGILLWYSDNNILSGNIANNCNNGVCLRYSNDNTLSGNTANDNSDNGIFLWYSDNNTISGNTINYNSIGIYLEKSNYNLITGNDLRYNNIAYKEIDSKGNTLNNNLGIGNDSFNPFIVFLIVLVISLLIIATLYIYIKKIKKPTQSKSSLPEEQLASDIISYDIDSEELATNINESAPLEEDVTSLTEALPEFSSMEKFNVFLSYSTLDSQYFQIKRLVELLGQYPEIEKVYYWEADSKENIVEFMNETLKKVNVFILLCSENSLKSKAVNDEWQAAFQMRKEGLLKIIPVYEHQDHIPNILWHLLNVKYTKDDFEGFLENLYNEILR